MLLKNAKQYTKKGLGLLKWLLANLIPLGGLIVSLKLHSQLRQAAQEQGITLKKHTAILVISGLIFPVLGANVIALGILQSDLNRIYAKEDALTNGSAV